MPYKFEQLEVWKLALDYIDLIYKIAEALPRSEEYDLKSQITRAATSVALNIVEEDMFKSRVYYIGRMKILRRLRENYNPFGNRFHPIKFEKTHLYIPRMAYECLYPLSIVNVLWSSS